MGLQAQNQSAIDFTQIDSILCDYEYKKSNLIATLFVRHNRQIWGRIFGRTSCRRRRLRFSNRIIISHYSQIMSVCQRITFLTY